MPALELREHSSLAGGFIIANTYYGYDTFPDEEKVTASTKVRVGNVRVTNEMMQIAAFNSLAELWRGTNDYAHTLNLSNNADYRSKFF